MQMQVNVDWWITSNSRWQWLTHVPPINNNSLLIWDDGPLSGRIGLTNNSLYRNPRYAGFATAHLVHAGKSSLVPSMVHTIWNCMFFLVRSTSQVHQYLVWNLDRPMIVQLDTSSYERGSKPNIFSVDEHPFDLSQRGHRVATLRLLAVERMLPAPPRCHLLVLWLLLLVA